MTILAVVLSAFILTALGEATATRLGSVPIAVTTIVWYGGVFLVLAWADVAAAILSLVMVLPLITVEVGLGDVSKTLSTDKVALAAVTGVWLVRRLPSAWPTLVRSPAVRWWVGVLGITLVSAMAHGATRPEGWALAGQVVYAAVFLAALDAFQGDTTLAGRTLWAAEASACAVALLALVEWVTWRWGAVVPLYFKHGTVMDQWVAGATISQVNFLGAYLVLFVPGLFARSLVDRGRSRALAVAAVAVTLVAFLSLRSMGAWIGLTVAGITMLAVVSQRPSARSTRVALAGGVVVLVMVTVGVILVKSRLEPSWLVRGAAYRIGMAAIAERPLIGHGANGYVRESLRLEAKLLGPSLQLPGRAPGSPLSAHSAFVNTGVERGLPGLLAFVGLLGSVVIVGWRAAGRAAATDAGLVLAAMLAGLSGVIVQALSENLFSYSKVTAMFWILAAALVSRAREPVSDPHDGKR
jgi:O-antigen ligase